MRKSVFVVLAAALVWLGWAPIADAQQTATVIYKFKGPTDGFTPNGGLVLDEGDLYGTTTEGGGCAFNPQTGCGTVFRLQPPAVGGTFWSKEILHNFKGGANDGSAPRSGPLLALLPKKGPFPEHALYGTTVGGGGVNVNVGIVYGLTHAGGRWVYMPIFTGFGVPDDQTTGIQPVAGLTTDNSVSSFWGTTTEGGAHGEGAVFQLTRSGLEGLVYSFCSRRNPTNSTCHDGQGANAATVGPDLELYGTTSFGGTFDGGIVYRVTIGGDFTVLHEFCKPPLCADGSHPFGRLIFDAQGALYGMTNSCGDPSAKVCQGTAFRMTPPPKGKSDWGFAVIHRFCGSKTGNTGTCPDGQNPIGGLVLDPQTGDLYGATSSGGKFGFGVIFKLKPRRGFPDEYYPPDVLHSFAPVNTGHPSLPEGDLVLDTQAGVLYGEAVGGNRCPGVFSCGVIYKIPLRQ